MFARRTSQSGRRPLRSILGDGASMIDATSNHVEEANGDCEGDALSYLRIVVTSNIRQTSTQGDISGGNIRRWAY
jgi:hypothetical protein